MSERVRVVARFSDGRLLKGSTQDFHEHRPLFHLTPPGGGTPVEIRCADLKAVMIVKTFEGDPQRIKLRGFLDAPIETTEGGKVAVRFKDGELLCGFSPAYAPEGDGFFVSPVDTGGNNLRVYVVRAATAEVKAGLAAEDLARRLLGGG